MKRARKDLGQEIRALKERLRTLVHSNMSEMRRTSALLQETERKIEDRFALLDSLETAWERAGRKFRKTANQNGAGIELNVLGPEGAKSADGGIGKVTTGERVQGFQ
jgi:hypothetical protein